MAAQLEAEDPVLARYVSDVKEDPDTLGVLLHGSRATGSHRDGSDYDLIRVVTQEAYDARRDQAALLKRVSLDDGSPRPQPHSGRWPDCQSIYRF